LSTPVTTESNLLICPTFIVSWMIIMDAIIIYIIILILRNWEGRKGWRTRSVGSHCCIMNGSQSDWQYLNSWWDINSVCFSFDMARTKGMRGDQMDAYIKSFDNAPQTLFAPLIDPHTTPNILCVSRGGLEWGIEFDLSKSSLLPRPEF
jgi:hypothetical protein